jgi:hypothetical protein
MNISKISIRVDNSDILNISKQTTIIKKHTRIVIGCIVRNNTKYINNRIKNKYDNIYNQTKKLNDNL